MKFLRKEKGFTLIELLVVVSIIGILATIIISAVNTARERAQTAKLITQFKQIESAFIFTYLDENRSSWWREDELDLGPNPTLKKIIDKENGPLSGFSNYFPHRDLVDDLSNSQYGYDNDTDTSASCSGGSSNWHKGVNLSITGLSLEQKKNIDNYVDKTEDYKCGKITYNQTNGGSLYWKISYEEDTF